MGKGGVFVLRTIMRRIIRVLWVIAVLAILSIIPWMIVDMSNSGYRVHTIAQTIAGVFTLAACILSIFLIAMHLDNFTNPVLQTHIVRILLMVPIYALNAWFVLMYKESAFFLDTIRKLYEAFVLYSFFAYLVEYLGGATSLHATVAKKEEFAHVFPFCCLDAWQPGEEFVEGCRTGINLYVFFRVLTTIIAFILQPFGWYHTGHLNIDSVYLYTTIINNCVSMWAVYCLVIFYFVLQDELRPINPLAKFLCVKMVVFFAWWQSVILVLVEDAGFLKNHASWTKYDVGDIAIGIQDFCICIEMLFLAMAHMWSFSYKEFRYCGVKDEEEDRDTLFRRACGMFDFRDIGHDVISTTTNPVLPHVPDVDRQTLDPLLGPTPREQHDSPASPADTPQNSARSGNTGDGDATSVDASSTEHEQPQHPEAAAQL